MGRLFFVPIVYRIYSRPEFFIKFPAGRLRFYVLVLRKISAQKYLNEQHCVVPTKISAKKVFDKSLLLSKYMCATKTRPTRDHIESKRTEILLLLLIASGRLDWRRFYGQIFGLFQLDFGHFCGHMRGHRARDGGSAVTAKFDSLKVDKGFTGIFYLLDDFFRLLQNIFS